MREARQVREEISAVGPDDYARVVEVWEAAVRATHTLSCMKAGWPLHARL